ncbi:MaoC family dehydratase N-terminal domain-containing protein [Elioraea sp.]|uniref:FAS1-like dehydratase domain-containing protein n=1 Tax=Elioraea sp. TaxID=2185103 RepID=UPI0021DF0AD3|nr:MaoC family dehydratase N-terminal domain-containing protein [Elioraea sp.]GIX11950.1 MAG: acyl-CoA dehydrogenase [Elioraea sp.]
MGEDLQAWVGRSETTEDCIDGLRLAGFAATLDRPLEAVAPGGRLPPLWHWMYFQHWVPRSGLGEDGHPRRGGFLPPVHHLPRRMWAGGRVTFRDDLFAGERIGRVSTITAIRETSGSTGPLVFVTVRHVVSGPRGVAIEEEQDIVYRGLAGAAVKPGTPAPPLPDGAFTETVIPDPVMLFRYSALTGNGHRIHYDRRYVTEVEGYPGLIVHGPLQATLMAGLLVRARPGRRLARIAYRGVRPLFDLAPFTVAGVEAGGTAQLWVRDAEGCVTMQAEASLAA